MRGGEGEERRGKGREGEGKREGRGMGRKERGKEGRGEKGRTSPLQILDPPLDTLHSFRFREVSGVSSFKKC